LEFYPKLCAFNISWHDRPKKNVTSSIAPKGYLLRDARVESGFGTMYAEFPALKLQ
jgi:hypothetical protein